MLSPLRCGGGRRETADCRRQTAAESVERGSTFSAPGDWCGTPHRNDRTRLRGASRLSPTLPPGGRQPTYFETCNRPVGLVENIDSCPHMVYNGEWVLFS
ncbi:MAG: hypothetical protein FWE95_03605 [Planctomycetaceae bacterium]|nr:hypothetical protein [Planctomycetaceae bacterium]